MSPTRDQRLSIVLVTGGPTLEAEGTAASTAALEAHLQTTDHRVEVINLADPERLLPALRSCDLVFNAVHGRGGEDGGVHYLAELVGGVPVTGPAWWVHSLGADKLGFKAWAAQFVRVPRNHDGHGVFPHGFVRKPRFGGGSIGVELLSSNHGDRQGEHVVVEEFIPGRIVSCCLYRRLAERMPLLVIDPAEGGVYDEGAKRGRADVGYQTVPIAGGWAEQVWNGSQRLYVLLGDRGPIRLDWIVEAETDDPVLLEINTNPGWRPTGNMGRIVSAAGFTYRDLVESVIVEALDVYPAHQER